MPAVVPKTFVPNLLLLPKAFCYLGDLKTTTRRKITPKKVIKTPPPPLQTGQVWELEGSNVHIGLIGKTLVHYKHFKGDTKRAPISLSGKTVLEKYLKENKAILTASIPCAAVPRATA